MKTFTEQTIVEQRATLAEQVAEYMRLTGETVKIVNERIMSRFGASCLKEVHPKDFRALFGYMDFKIRQHKHLRCFPRNRDAEERTYPPYPKTPSQM